MYQPTFVLCPIGFSNNFVLFASKKNFVLFYYSVGNEIYTSSIA